MQLEEMFSSIREHGDSKKETWGSKSSAGAVHTLAVSLLASLGDVVIGFLSHTGFLDTWGGISELQIAFPLFVKDHLTILTNFLV